MKGGHAPGSAKPKTKERTKVRERSLTVYAHGLRVSMPVEELFFVQLGVSDGLQGNGQLSSSFSPLRRGLHPNRSNSRPRLGFVTTKQFKVLVDVTSSVAHFSLDCHPI